jgi:hypothetical protein
MRAARCARSPSTLSICSSEPAESPAATSNGAAGKSGRGTSFGMTEGLACLQAKLTASQIAGCPGRGQGGSCSCKKMGPQIACDAEVTCP